MNPFTVFFIGTCLGLVVITYWIYTIYVLIKNKDKPLEVGTYVVGVILLSSFLCITSFFASYFYLSEKGFNLYYESKYQNAINRLEGALVIRNFLGKKSKVLDGEIFGIPLPPYTEVVLRFSLAQSYERLEKYNKAISEYNKIISIEENNFEALYGMYNISVLTENLENAKYYASNLIKAKPTVLDKNQCLKIGQAYMILSNTKEAEKYFYKSLDLGKEEIIVRPYLDMLPSIKENNNDTQ